jgi:hypothetical protein
MPQHGSDFIQGSPGSQHHRGSRVSKQIRAVRGRVLNAGPPECRANNVRDERSRPEGTERRFSTEKQAIDCDPWACPLEIVQNRVSGILRQGELDVPTSLASHQEQGLLPINIR